MDLSVRPVPYGYKSTPFFKIITKRYIHSPAGARTLSFIKFSTSHNNTYRFGIITGHYSQKNESSFNIFDGGHLVHGHGIHGHGIHGHWNGPKANGLDNIILSKQEKGYLTTPFFG